MAAYERGRRGAAGVFLDAEHVSLGRSEFSGGEVSLRLSWPTIPTPRNFRVRDVALPEGLTTDRFDTRRDLRQLVDRFQRIAEHAAGDPVNAVDDVLSAGIQPDDEPGGTTGVRHPQRAGRGARSNTAATGLASRPCWLGGWSKPACRS